MILFLFDSNRSFDLSLYIAHPFFFLNISPVYDWFSEEWNRMFILICKAIIYDVQTTNLIQNSLISYLHFNSFLSFHLTLFWVSMKKKPKFLSTVELWTLKYLILNFNSSAVECMWDGRILNSSRFFLIPFNFIFIRLTE